MGINRVASPIMSVPYYAWVASPIMLLWAGLRLLVWRGRRSVSDAQATF